MSTDRNKTDSCPHLGQIKDVTAASRGCEECLKMGTEWVHLRICMTCGHVGCCDESKQRHAHAHFRETGHAIMRSMEPGEDWLWCYADQALIFPSSESGSQVHVATSKEFLRKLPLFEGMNEEDLDRLADMAEPKSLKPGEILMTEGEPGDALYVVLDGELEVLKQGQQSDIVLGLRHAGEVIGEMSLLDQAPRIATVRALASSRLLMITLPAFQEVLRSSPTAVSAILRTVTARLRSTQTLLVQSDKMASLGTLAAGLAHELNNPAAAVRRSADQLAEVLTNLQKAAQEMNARVFTAEELTVLATLREQVEEQRPDRVPLDPLERSDREVEVESWLDNHAVGDAWEHAPALVPFGWGVPELDALAEQFSAEHLPVVIPWLVAAFSVNGLLDEVKEGASRIGDIVKAVKTYSYLDQAPVQDVDVHQGLDNTLVILKHKLKEGVTVRREYAPDLPRIEAYASELNQVWTNILDNAIDAMNGNGEIIMKTYARKEAGVPFEVVVEIKDNGPGIPPAVQERIFEPFYTTKGPGAGTGLGLYIAYNIVTDKHRGRIVVTSTPGETCFQVTLPIKLARPAASATAQSRPG